MSKKLSKAPLKNEHLLSTSDQVFMAAMREAGVSDPPTQKQLDRMYANIEGKLLEAICGFGVDELHQMIEHAKAIRARRPS